MSRASRYPLRRWIWRAFVQSALIPLILVESVLIAVYLLTNSAIRDAQLDYLQQRAVQDLTAAVQREGQIIDGRLQGIEAQVRIYRDAVAQALADKAYQPDALERQRHALTADGVFYSRSDDGRAASFYASSTPQARQDHAKALRLMHVDPLMRSIQAASPLVSAIYFNSWDSYNRIYPFFLTPDRYPHDMVIPDYNFYYLADARHNPARKVVWTDVYLDPAGLGWMMSAVAPVYRGDFLEGVVGLDITIGKMLAEIGSLQVPWQGYAMLVGRDNSIMALPEAGEGDFGLNELTQHDYLEAVQQETFKPADFNLAQRRELQPLLQAMAANPSSVQEVLLGGRKQLLAWSEIPQTGWRLLLVVDEANIFQQTNRLAEHYRQIGYLLIAGLLSFYALFFAWMWRRSRRLSDALAAPLQGIAGMLQRLGLGDYRPQAPSSSIVEIASMGAAVVQAGAQLQASETQRQHAQRKLELILESTTESLWELDSERLTFKLGERFIRRFGLPYDQMPLAEYNLRVHPDDRDRLRHLRLLCRESESENSFDAEYRFADAQGQYAWLLSRGQVLERDADGMALRVAGTHVDITRLKRVQEELRRTSVEAQSASQAKSRFLSSMSHELRTPLNAIHGFAQLIELEAEEQGETQPVLGYSREILNASRHLTSLVDDILDLSSIESRRQQLQLQPIEAGALLAGCAELVQPEVQQRGQQLQVMSVEPPLYVLGDARRLRQVLLNLLSNAIKYNSTYGLVSLGYEVRPGCVRLWVEDGGAGLSAEQQAQLFQPFQRLGWENSTTPGAGIGLVLCRELAELMDGEIGFSSSPGVGSRFWIDLPSAAAPQAAADAQAHSPVAAPRALAQVLCVEDHPACLKVLQEGLREFAEVRGVASVQRALAALDERVPALLLLDLDLPDGDGLEVLDHLRHSVRLREVPVLVISATADEAAFAEARRRGAQACLAKPVDLQQVRRLALSLLGRAP
ncbi:ATP-binding protein [Pseudomonas sp. LS44]|uniref:ATP-binding protein n=1 Tax=Pseudomonas sp. LS44 TaxID=1357074 RepID=UPI00215AEF69|nr:ATP-binding protein [Pseudomonas sp. LS44]UVE17093.1 ATP-binding protein [Pseudomonas sp. LS44]